MKELSIEEKVKAYDGLIERLKGLKFACRFSPLSDTIEEMFPELKESEDEQIRKALISILKSDFEEDTTIFGISVGEIIVWLEKQGSEPNWCHHKVDLSNCPEEYRKAYYNGWNNCNQQHSQCKSEGNDVVKCLINGMKFYYEDNEEATWGTEKFSMKVKDILSWLEKQGNKDMGISNTTKQKLKDNLDNALEKETPESWNEFLEKQGEQKPAWSEKDEEIHRKCICAMKASACGFPEEEKFVEQVDNWLKNIKDRVQPQPKQEWNEEDKNMLQSILDEYKSMPIEKRNWLKSLKNRYTWKPSGEQMKALHAKLNYVNSDRELVPDVISIMT